MVLTIQNITIPFKHTFSHATATRSCTESILVIAESVDGVIGIGEGCPRNYVTGETVSSTMEFFDAHRQAWQEFRDLDDLTLWMKLHTELIRHNPSAWCAVELALLDLWGNERGQSIEQVLNLYELSGQFYYSAVLGTENLVAFEKQAAQFSALGMWTCKMKVNGHLQQDREKLEYLQNKIPENLCLRLDANNLWKNAVDVITYLQDLKFPFMAIEEPLQVGDYDGCREINQRGRLPIILDESFLWLEQFEHVHADPQSWIVNIRISKMGGILRSLEIAQEARARGIPIIIGAQVGETSILTRAALTVANQCRDILQAQEGAFGTYLLQQDLATPSLMFGQGGIIDSHSLLNQSGLGLTLTTST